ncbi:hypothetical protein GCM10028807_00110 [Spirosoma daeguense]
MAQQPVPAKKKPTKARTSAPVHQPTKQVDKPKTDVAKATATVPAAATSINAQGVAVDTETGLALGENMVLVKGQCTVCHSSKLILQSRFDRDKWIERIRWMQRTQKLWDLGETEKPILDYLVANYGPGKTPFDSRRLPLPTQAWYKQ